MLRGIGLPWINDDGEYYRQRDIIVMLMIPAIDYLGWKEMGKRYVVTSMMFRETGQLWSRMGRKVYTLTIR